MPSQRVYFENESGVRLSGLLELPETPVAFALFSHCFTCTKDLKAIVRISRGLARHGIGVLRFDFTGLGDSHGVFADSNFESNLADIRAAVAWLTGEYGGPQLLLGHSLGGAAMMAAASEIESARALATLASPSCTKHLAEFLDRTNPAIRTSGEGQVTIGGRTHTMKRQLLDSLANNDLKPAIANIRIPHLVLHSPADETLAFRHAEEIFALTGGAKALITLVDSDHLFVNRPSDVTYVADLIATWSKRFLGEPVG